MTLFIARMAPQSSMYCLRSRSRYSNTSVRDLSVCTMSWRVTATQNRISTKVHENFTITEKAPTRAFSWLKAPTNTFTLKTLC